MTVGAGYLHQSTGAECTREALGQLLGGLAPRPLAGVSAKKQPELCR
jgi:hypothetical protein